MEERETKNTNPSKSTRKSDLSDLTVTIKDRLAGTDPGTGLRFVERITTEIVGEYINKCLKENDPTEDLTISDKQKRLEQIVSQRRELVEKAIRLMRHFHLAARHPQTGEPCRLMFAVSGTNRKGRVHFRSMVKDSKTPPKSFTEIAGPKGFLPIRFCYPEGDLDFTL